MHRTAIRIGCLFIVKDLYRVRTVFMNKMPRPASIGSIHRDMRRQGFMSP